MKRIPIRFSIRKKLILTVFILIIFPFAGVSIGYIHYTQTLLTEKAIVTHQHTTKQIGKDVEVIIHNMQMASQILLANSEMLDIVANNIYEDPESYFKHYKMINNFFTELQYSVLFYPNSFIALKDVYDNIHIGQGISRYNMDDRIRAYLCEEIDIEAIQDTEWVGTIENRFSIHEIAPYLVTMLKKVYGYADSVIMVSVDEGVFYKALKDNVLEKEIQVYLIDNEKRVISTTERELIGKSLEGLGLEVLERESEGVIDNKAAKEFISIYPIKDNDWWIIERIPYALIYKETEALVNLLIGIHVIFFLLCITISLLAFMQITLPLTKLTEGMKQVEAGNFKVNVKLKQQDEIGKLSQAFNQMVEKIRNLIEEVNLKEQEKRVAELNMLRMQIKPHFLFNTLNSIRWVAEMNRAKPVSELIVSLSALLKSSLLEDRTLISLGEELRNLEHYCKIQKVRYGGIFDVIYDLEEGVEGYKCLNLMLQPIVENSLIHGLEGMSRRGEIRIEARTIGEDLILTIKDNGKGMEEVQCEKLLSKESKGGIGVRNVHERLQMHFGEIYGLEMSSALGEGVITQIKLPKIEKE